MLYYCTVKVVLSVFTAIAILTELRATDSCFTKSIMAGLRQTSVPAKTPKLATTMCLGAAAAVAAAGGVWIWGQQEENKVPCFCRVGISRGGGLRPSVSALMTFFEVDCVCRGSCTT